MSRSIGTAEAADSAAVSPAADTGLLADARRLWHEMLGLAQDSLHLAALETRLAGQSLVAMIAAGVIVAVLLVTAWLGLVASAIVVLVGSGVSVSAAILLGVLANLVIALLPYLLIRRKSRNLRWGATIRSLTQGTGARGAVESHHAH